jgi:RIO kinase 1
MKTPEGLAPLLDYGIIQEVIRPLMSGKEAQVYVVLAGGKECVAKVYKEASQRTFKHRTEYTEGRRSRNSRDQRAVSKRTRHGRKQDEAAWRSAEVDTIYRLRDAGVRVPEPINFVDGVLVMELVKDAHGNPAPRLGDLSFEADEACRIYRGLIQEVIRMLCAGVIHGDLSDFNVLMGVDGPVLIDFPQSVDPTHNQNARKLLLRDVDNLHSFVERFSPDERRLPHAQEMWSLYETNRLDPETRLRGDYRGPEGKASTDEVLALIDDANLEEQGRRRARGEEAPAEDVSAPGPIRKVVTFSHEPNTKPGDGEPGAAGRGASRGRSRGGPAGKRAAAKATSADAAAAPEKEGAAPRKRRGRRRRKGSASGRVETTEAASRSDTTATRVTEKTPTDADASNRPKGRRRRKRSGTRSKSDQVETEAKGSAKRPARSAAGTRSGGRAGKEKGGGPGASGRPSRRGRS